MMRTAAPRRPEIAIATLSGGAQQKRHKTFLQQRDERNRIYHTVNKFQKAPKMPRDDELFQINNLLLDLDGIDNKHVRACDEEDEHHMQWKWAVQPTRQRLRARIREFKPEFRHSRYQALKMSSNPADALRLAAHDVLSVALRGTPAVLAPVSPVVSDPLIDSVEEDQREDLSSLTVCEALDPRRRLDILHTVFSENNISDYAFENDELLMHWLRLRQGPFQLGHERAQDPPSPAQLVEALKQQSSITSIRRLVFQSLSFGLDATLFQVLPISRREAGLSQELRSALEYVLDQCAPGPSGHLEAMAFMGNLRQRLSSGGAHMGAPLCGLGLRLAAATANAEAALEYFEYGFKHNFWSETPYTMEDILYVLETYSYHLTRVSETPPLDVLDRESLLQMLTGLDEKAEVSPNSFRTLVLSFLSYPDTKDRLRAVRICKAYIVTLGRLGAVATLWKEWRLLQNACGVERKAQTGTITPLGDDDRMAEAFVAAGRAALSVVARREGAVPADLKQAGCAMMDFESIEMQNPEAWLGNQEDVGPIEGFSGGDIHAALNLPLDGWLDAVQRAAGSKKRSPRCVGG